MHVRNRLERRLEIARPEVPRRLGRGSPIERSPASGLSRVWIALWGFVVLTLAPARATPEAGDGGQEVSSTPVAVVFTIDSGGGTSTAGELELTGTVGQPDTGVVYGVDLVLAGGFWATVPSASIFADGFESGDLDAWSGSAP